MLYQVDRTADYPYTAFNATPDAGGQAIFTLPLGEYRFRANLRSNDNILSGFQDIDFWSGAANHCALPGCETVQILVPKPVVLTILDADNLPQAGLEVSAYNAETIVNHDFTDATGTVKLFMPDGSYHYNVQFMGTTYWNSPENNCTTPGCDAVQITLPKPVTVSVLYENGNPYPDVEVYLLDGETPTSYSAVTNAAGQAIFQAPIGIYRFAADIKGTLFYSDLTNHCAVPGCETAAIEIPGGYEYQEVTIDYTYDGLYRLTKAEYSTGEVFEYTYDATGNRLTQTVTIDEFPVTTTYAYDEANRLTQVGEQDYIWDANGNLLDDGQRQYSYDAANRLTALADEEHDYAYAYNGLGDRVSQSVDGVTETYQLDLNAGLTQVLSNGPNTYLYGRGRIAQEAGDEINNFLPDGLGSVRTVLSGITRPMARFWRAPGRGRPRMGMPASGRTPQITII